jgi:chaperonin GroEL
MKQVVQAPCRQIADNAGIDGAVVARNVLKEKGAYGFNALSGEYGDMFEFGVVDATKVTKSALTNAVSVATLLLTTDAIVTSMPEDDEGHHDDDMDM